ncbi:MAG: hypothetical protein WCC21_02525 [Candidatus Acidiferrales bacterium]
MIRDQSTTVAPAYSVVRALPLNKPAASRYRLVSRFFARSPVKEAVATRIRLDGNPETVWNHLLFYEEVPGRAPFPLRALLPRPVRAEGVKTRVGTRVCCAYSRGQLVKRITRVEPPHFLQFEVVEQDLGIESCILTFCGSYTLSACGPATEVTIMTNYHAYLRPRYLWRPLEAFLIHQLHSHILRGVGAVVLPRDPIMRPFVAESFPSPYVPPGDLACTASPSRSRR